MRRMFKILLCCTLVLQCFFMTGCRRSEMISEVNDDTHLSMEVSDYTDKIERAITIKNTQKGRFSVEIMPADGNIDITIADEIGVKILSMNQDASLSNSPAVIEIPHGNGTYQLTVNLNEYNGSFDVFWTVEETQ